MDSSTEALRQKNEKIGELEARNRSLSSDLERTARERDELGDQVADKNLEIENLRSQLSQQQPPENLGEGILKRNAQIAELEKRNRELVLKIGEGRDKRAELEKEIKSLRYSVQVARQQLADIKDATPGLDLPEASDLLNQLKARNRKSKVTLSDCEAMLELLDP